MSSETERFRGCPILKKAKLLKEFLIKKTDNGQDTKIELH